MITLDDLLNGNDYASQVFRKLLVKNGQINSAALFKVDELKSLKDGIFTKILRPLIQFTDCSLRIISLKPVNYNFVFLIKEPTLRGLSRKLADYKGIELEVVNRERLDKYRADIEFNNRQKMVEYLDGHNYYLETEHILDNLEGLYQSVKPYYTFGVTYSLKDLVEIFAENWREQFAELIEESKEEVRETLEAVERKKQLIIDSVEINKFYWSNKSLPLYYDIKAKIKTELRDHITENFNNNEVEDFLRSHKNMIAFTVKREEDRFSVVKRSFEGVNYEFKRNDRQVDILENGKPLKKFNDRKREFLANTINDILKSSIEFKLSANLKDNKTIYMLYKPRAIEIIENIIEIQDPIQLKILVELFNKGFLYKYKKVYYKSIVDLIKMIEDTRSQEALLSYMIKSRQDAGFFRKLFYRLFSPSKEAVIYKRIDLNRIYVRKSINKVIRDRIKNIKEEYSPVVSAINIIKSDLKLDILRDIIDEKTMTVEDKMEQIFNLYQDIGNTNKAIIKKSESNIKEFIDKVKYLVKYRR